MAKNKNEKAVDFTSVKNELMQHGPQPLYFIWGKEDYLSDYMLQNIKNLCIGDGAEDFSYRKLTERDFSPKSLSEAIDSVPFLTERTLVEVRGIDLNKIKDTDAKEIINLLKDIPDYCTVAFTEPASFEPDKRLKFYKSFIPLVTELHFVAQPSEKLTRWIVSRFSAAGKGIEPNAVQELISVSGDLMNNLIPEINKVASYAKGDKVTVEDVKAVAHHIPEAVIFDMLECLTSGKNNAAMSLLNELILNKDIEASFVLALLANQMRQIYVAKIAIASGKGKDYVMKTCAIKYDFIATKMMAFARRFSISQLKRAVEICTETDYAMKSTGIDADELLKECVLKIAVGEDNVQSK